jgi:hypothetical protein
MYSQPIVHKALSWGTIRKSAYILAEITIRKSQPLATPIRKVGRKPTKKDRVQHTIYLPPVLSKWLKIDAFEEGREISDIVADAILVYKERKDSAIKE